jgi:Na+/H+-dicarboxylate symporter
VACSLYFPLLGSIPSAAEGGEVKIDAIAEMIFGIIPANIVEPFATGNTLQIIFLAIVVGIALLYLGRKANGIAWAVDQVNTLVQMLMQALSQLVPYVIFLVMVSMVWSGKLSVLATSWKLFAATLSAVSLITLVFVVATCVRMKVSPVVLIRKCVPTFVLALSTASSAAAFGTIVETCERRFGIDESIVKFGVPLGIVIEKPATAAFFLLLVFFLADQYDVTCSISWICIAVFVSAVVAIASPPVPGGAAVALTALFVPVGIPMEALAIALAIDIVIDFFKTAFQMTVLQLSLVNISAGMGSIDANVLRDPEA